jgi:hypothetical protein
MPARKIRVEVFDSEGNRYTIAFEGTVTREKAVRLLDLVELLGGMPSGQNPKMNVADNELSKFDNTRLIIDKNFPTLWFSSRDVQSAYEQEFKEPISLSTVSTYLSRMADRGVLAKGGRSNRRLYRSMTKVSQGTLKVYQRQ